nr:zinc finger protein 488 [Marmota flaviventris]
MAPGLQNPKALKTDGCWSVHLAQPAQHLLIIMAAGKEAPLSTSAENRWGISDPEQSLGHKQVLLEKTNHLGSITATSTGGLVVGSAELAVPTVPDKPRLGKPLPRKAHGEERQSAFMDMPQLHERLGGDQEKEHKDASAHPDPQQHSQDVPRAPMGNTVSSVWPGTTRGEQRSAFSKPTKRRAERPGPTSIFRAGESADSLMELSGFFSTLDIPCWGRMSTSKLVVGDFWNLHTLSQNALLCSTFQGAPVLWLEHTQAQVPTSSTASRALLPPTITSLGFSTQNWCAKCSLSFRLTSDLVFHMRSHHKKEHVGPDPHSKKRREEALICPVCREYFRERHHLSRHMTSHS